MKVVLLKDIKNFAKKGEVAEAADGYAKNYLFKNNLAVPATEQALKKLDKEKEIMSKEIEEKRKEAEIIKHKYIGKTYYFNLKNNQEKVSGSVSYKDLIKALKEDGLSIDKKMLIDFRPINTLGRNEIKIQLFKDIMLTVFVEID